MDMPTPNELHEKLTCLVGSWSGVEQLHPSQWLPQGDEANSTAIMRVDLNGFVVICDYRQERNGRTTFAGHGVYTIDPATSEVVLHWFDSMGGQLEQFRGNWDGDVLTIQGMTAMGHMRLRYDCSDPNVLKNSAEMSPDGENWSRMFDGHLTRR